MLCFGHNGTEFPFQGLFVSALRGTEMKNVWTECSSVRMLLRIGTELWWIWLYNNVNKLYLHTALPLCISLMYWSFRTGLIMGKHAEFVLRSLYLTVRSPHPWKAVAFFVICHQDKFPYNYCTWQVGIVTLAWINWAVTCCAYRTGPERAEDFLSSFDGGNKELQNTHTERPLASHWLTSTVIYVHATDVGCHRACACVAVLLCMMWERTVGQLHPAETLLLLGAATDSQYETWHHSGRLTKTIRATPCTSQTSTFSPVFLSSSTLFNYAFTLRIYTTQVWIRRIIPRAGSAPFFITSSWIT